MNITHRFALTEDQLRAIRASESRSGRATRDEVRSWLDVLIEATLRDLPAPKRRRKPEPVKRTAAERHATAATAPPDAVCRWCGKVKEDHGRMGFACPAPTKGTFEPVLPSQ